MTGPGPKHNHGLSPLPVSRRNWIVLIFLASTFVLLILNSCGQQLARTSVSQEADWSTGAPAVTPLPTAKPAATPVLTANPKYPHRLTNPIGVFSDKNMAHYLGAVEQGRAFNILATNGEWTWLDVDGSGKVWALTKEVKYGS